MEPIKGNETDRKKCLYYPLYRWFFMLHVRTSNSVFFKLTWCVSVYSSLASSIRGEIYAPVPSSDPSVLFSLVHIVVKDQDETSLRRGIFSLGWRPFGGFGLFFTLWSGCCLFYIFHFSRFSFICFPQTWKCQLVHIMYSRYDRSSKLVSFTTCQLEINCYIDN